VNRLLLLLQLATTLPLAGLIWTIQVVHYPLFAGVGPTRFAAYHADHSRLISLLVVPLMCVELLSALATFRWPDEAMPRWFGPAMLGLVGLAWATTALGSVPAHGQLAQGFDAAAHARLVHTNWLRTLAWTARSAMLLWAVARQLPPTPPA
jgi:hypothetical protein